MWLCVIVSLIWTSLLTDSTSNKISYIAASNKKEKKKGDPWNQSCHQSLMGAEILSVFSQDFQWFVLIR